MGTYLRRTGLFSYDFFTNYLMNLLFKSNLTEHPSQPQCSLDPAHDICSAYLRNFRHQRAPNKKCHFFVVGPEISVPFDFVIETYIYFTETQISPTQQCFIY